MQPCSPSSIKNRTGGFDFQKVYDVQRWLNETCPSSSEKIWFQQTQLLNRATCEAIAGPGWKAYGFGEIWSRLATWKLPLIQLVSQFPRPPLGLSVETGTILHLLGDPVDSITVILLTLSICNSRATLAKKLCAEADFDVSDPQYDHTWRSLAIIMVSYDDCGIPESVPGFCREYLENRKLSNFEDETRHVYNETASSLAADRQTKSLPVVVAQVFFIGSWLIALFKTGSSKPSPANWPNIEAHSIAFSGLYLWVTSAVTLGSIIGASQTEGSIPRLLQGMEYHLDVVSDRLTPKPSAGYREDIEWCKTGRDRAVHGGVYSWRPTKWHQRKTRTGSSDRKLAAFVLSALVVFGASFFTAFVLSWGVPPKGPSCRHIPEALMVAIWLLSFLVECFCERWLKKWLFWAVFSKDLFFTLSNFGIILVTQWGILNRCACWCQWGQQGVHLPQLAEVEPELMHYIRHVAPWITNMAILFQLLFCAAVVWKYWDGVRVYIQRDDGLPNLRWRRPKPS